MLRNFSVDTEQVSTHWLSCEQI